MGKLLIDSINLLDRPVIVAYLLITVFMFIVINLAGRPALLDAGSARAPGRQQGIARFDQRSRERRRSDASRRISRDSPIAVFGLALLGLIVLLAILAPLISPQNPYDLAQLDVVDGRLPPGSVSADGRTFWLGTDDQGRDMLSAIFYGLRISLARRRGQHGARARASGSRSASPRPTSAAGSRR